MPEKVTVAPGVVNASRVVGNSITTPSPVSGPFSKFTPLRSEFGTAFLLGARLSTAPAATGFVANTPSVTTDGRLTGMVAAVHASEYVGESAGAFGGAVVVVVEDGVVVVVVVVVVVDDVVVDVVDVVDAVVEVVPVLPVLPVLPLLIAAVATVCGAVLVQVIGMSVDPIAIVRLNGLPVVNLGECSGERSTRAGGDGPALCGVHDNGGVGWVRARHSERAAHIE